MPSLPCPSYCSAAPEDEAEIILNSSSSSYSVLEKIGYGSFGNVYRCQNKATKEEVAVKVFREHIEKSDIEYEVAILEAISVKIPDSNYMVKFFERFQFKGMECLVLEMLDKSLYDFMGLFGWKPMSLHLIRPIAMQMLMALDALSVCDILHADIKPDNIMFVNMQYHFLSVKLIDFGNAFIVNDVQHGMHIQPMGYRAPEIVLGLPFTKTIDVWGLGCVLGFLYLARNPFTIRSEYQMMKSMVELLGQPEDHLLQAGMYTEKFFIKEEAAEGPTWRLMTPEEYSATNNRKTEWHNNTPDQLRCLEDLVSVVPIQIYPEDCDGEYEDRRVFVDLLKRLLHIDGAQRISAHEALQHPFITMDHLVKRFHKSNYLNISQLWMDDCQMESSQEIKDLVCPSVGEIHTISAPWYPHEERLTDLDEEGSKVCYSDGEIYTISASWYLQEEQPARLDEGGSDICSSYGEIQPNSAPWYPHKVRSAGLHEEESDVCSSDGEILISASWYPHEEQSAHVNEDGSDVCSSDGEIHTISASWYHHDEQPARLDEEGSEVWYSDGEIHTISVPCYPHVDQIARSDEESSNSCSSDGEVRTISASWYPHKEQSLRLDEKESGICYSDGEICPISAPWYPHEVQPKRLDEVDPDVCSSDGEIRTISAPWYLHEERPARLVEEDSDICSSNGDVALVSQACRSHKDLSLISYEEDSLSSDEGVSDSSGRPRKWLKRIYRFICRIGSLFRQCWRPSVGD